MGPALDRYRRIVCQREGHTHGEEGELECILTTLARLQAEASAAPAPPAPARPLREARSKA